MLPPLASEAGASQGRKSSSSVTYTAIVLYMALVIAIIITFNA